MTRRRDLISEIQSLRSRRAERVRQHRSVAALDAKQVQAMCSLIRWQIREERLAGKTDNA